MSARLTMIQSLRFRGKITRRVLLAPVGIILTSAQRPSVSLEAAAPTAK